MWKRVREYMQGSIGMNYYLKTDSVIEWVAFSFLSCCYCIWRLFFTIISFVTAPLWIIPYVVYFDIKHKGGKK